MLVHIVAEVPYQFSLCFMYQSIYLASKNRILSEKHAIGQKAITPDERSLQFATVNISLAITTWIFKKGREMWNLNINSRIKKFINIKKLGFLRGG